MNGKMEDPSLARRASVWGVAAVVFGALALLAGGGMEAFAQGRVEFEKRRKYMVEEFIVKAGVKDERVIKAMLSTPRHEFVPMEMRDQAYYDKALAIGDKQTISSPLIVSQMTEALDPQPTDKVLEIGTGSGFQAAVLSPLVKDVYSIEIVELLGKKAAALLKRLRYDNVHTKVGDGFLGWPEHAPFDKIIVTCSPEAVPEPLKEQLKEGGLMIVPVGERYRQTLYSFRKKEGKLVAQKLLPTLFVPMTGKAEAVRAVKPDPLNPRIDNGSFEEEAFAGGGQPGWYYEKHITWETDRKSPDGEHYVTFKNLEPSVSAHLLQGFGVDGRKVKELEISAYVKTENAKAGPLTDEKPFIVVTLYDDQRRELSYEKIGPFLGDSDWRRVKERIIVKPNTREAIFRIGLFGATGSASFDKVEMKKVD